MKRQLTLSLELLRHSDFIRSWGKHIQNLPALIECTFPGDRDTLSKYTMGPTEQKGSKDWSTKTEKYFQCKTVSAGALPVTANHRPHRSGAGRVASGERPGALSQVMGTKLTTRKTGLLSVMTGKSSECWDSWPSAQNVVIDIEIRDHLPTTCVLNNGNLASCVFS